MPWLWVNTKCSIPRVQHTPTIVCHHFILMSTSWPLNVGSASTVPPYRLTATSQFSIRASEVLSPCHIPKGSGWLSYKYSLSNPVCLSLTASWLIPSKVLLQYRSIIASKYIFKRTWSQPPSASPNSLNNRLQVHVQTRSITASMYISEFTQFRSPIASPTSVHYRLPVHLWVHSILTSQCISELAPSWPPSASPNNLYQGFGVYRWVR